MIPTRPTSTAPKIRLVVAGSFDQFITWCYGQGIDTKNARVKYVRNPEDLLGHDNAELVKTGTWYLREKIVPAVKAFEQRYPSKK